MAYYDRYRGSRRKRRNQLKIALLVLLLLVVVGLAALFFLQDTVIFTNDGFRFPFAPKENTQKNDPPLDPDDVPLEITDPQPGSADLRPAQPATTPTAPTEAPTQPPVELPQMAALLLDGNALVQDSAAVLRRVSEGSYSQLALQVKSPEGIALLDDGLVAEGISADADAFAAALEKLDVNRIAVISALRDNIRPRTGYRAASLKLDSGSTWLDREYLSWFDPTAKDTLPCLLAMIDACEAAGFEQVLLQNFRYPTTGKLELINYGDAATRTEAITQLARQLREGTDLPLSMVLTAEAATQLTDGTAGLDIRQLAQFFAVLYVPASDFSADLTALDAAVADTGCRIGLAVVGNAPVPAGFDRDFVRIP